MDDREHELKQSELRLKEREVAAREREVTAKEKESHARWWKDPVAVLRGYSATHHKISKDDKEPFFAHRDGRAVSKDNIYRWFRKVIWAAGIPHGGRSNGEFAYPQGDSASRRATRPGCIATGGRTS